MDHFDPEGVDLARLATQLRDSIGAVVDGDIVALTVLRDEVVRRLDCSQLEAETLVDTMVQRGFVKRSERADGGVELHVGSNVANS